MSRPEAGVRPGGPYFDELALGDVFDGAPAVTLTAGDAALHRAIVGDRLRLALDERLAERVTGAPGLLAHPALVWDVAIGQSTVVTRRVIANLFYRGFILRRAPRIGDTLRTTTTVEALRETSRRPDRAPSGLAVLRIVTVDQEERPVLDFHRCAMLPLRPGAAPTGLDAPLEPIGEQLDAALLAASWEGWDLGLLTPTAVAAGDAWTVEGADVVSCAPELARLTLNIATAHHDRTANVSGRRLVYGGHTIAVAAAQLTRLLPDLVTVAGWHGCDHLAPVFEGDLLRTAVAVEQRDGALVHLRCAVEAERADGERVDVLDWRPVAVVA
ncbi:MaoC family dehydratase [Conexibacter stalactiti]|uniref:MaoC family dehydratase n=1 Tax=Conexibacter stalactiti TaxID=1940611 RepID=UPI003851342F